MTVYLVGAGPGDPGLLTVKGAEVLAGADVVVHDRLAESSLLDLAPVTAERVDVGKAPGAPVPQADINALLVERGRAGLQVVRLKGGDPFVFGRGGEEAAALRDAGVPWEVVPGVTSAVAVPAYAGVPVVQRGRSTSFTVVTGHSRHAVDTETNWTALAQAGGTIVILMGVAHRAEIAERLMAGGLAADTPVVATTWGTRPQQRTVRTTLARLGAENLEPPATIVVGAVAGLDLAWYERRPLLGRRVVVTRARAQASQLAARLAGLGAACVEVPTIAVADPADGGDALAAAAHRIAGGAYRWVAFASANAVTRLGDLLPDGRMWAGTGLAAVGPATADALAARGLRANLVPDRAVAEVLVEAFPAPDAGPAGGARPIADAGPDAVGGSGTLAGAGPAGGARPPVDVGPAGGSGTLAGAGPAGGPRALAGPDPDRPPAVLLPRAAEGRNVLAVGLAAKGWRVEPVEAYRTVPVAPSADQLAAAASADAICFSSSSTVTNYLAAADRVPPVVACIGPVTAETARQAGLDVTVVADPHTIAGLLDALVAVLGR
ncbi:MAG TPA: uroporphyrinogen-III C-methyltransferase [Acidimicrobiales bacterium]|nr:uroporphyrinogen-III C-methyltransferase [Acidimicrobiales bacterium]